jgi:uncharacterized protein
VPELPSRITALDALRGVGVLGILPVHMQSFAMVVAARVNPSVAGDLQGPNGWQGPDGWIWLATAVLADGKFISIFAMLFGAGLLLLSGRGGDGLVPVERLHHRRMALLVGVGLLHAYLLWYGDMLVTFALCGAVVFGLRALPPRGLLTRGALALSCASLIALGVGCSLPWWSPDTKARFVQVWAPSREMVEREVAAYRGGWWGQMAYRAPEAFQIETSQLVLRGFWETSGLMLVGMGLFKLGVLSGTRSARFYAAMTGLGFGVGLPIAWYGAARARALDWDLADFMVVGTQLSYWGDLLVGVGWVGLVMLLCRAGWRARAVAAVGRTALSNYLLQTVLCTTIFYGHGLGLFARVERVGQLLIVVGIWIVQLTWSVWWTRRFAVGPLEWVWRRAARGSAVPAR